MLVIESCYLNGRRMDGMLISFRICLQEAHRLSFELNTEIFVVYMLGK